MPCSDSRRDTENSGFSITPHVLPFRPDFLSAVNRGDAGHLYMVGWNGDWGDPDECRPEQC